MPSDERRFSRIHDDPVVRRSPLVAGPAGLIAGAIALFGAWLWEAALWHRLGDSVPEALWQTDGAAVALIGAGVGFLCGITGLWGSAWLTSFAVSMVGILVATRMAAILPTSGVLIIGIGTLLALIAGQVLGRVPVPDRVRRLLAPWAGLVLAAAAPMYLHLMPGTESTALLGTVLVAILLFPVALFAQVLIEFGRGFMAPILGFAVVGAGAYTATDTGPQAWPQTEVEAGPLVVVVVVSGLRADRLEGYSQDVTPNLNRLAQLSVTYTQASATAPWSAPSIASILTSRLPYRHGAGARHRGAPTDAALRVDVPSWPTALQRAGFATAAVVGDSSLQIYGLDRGFDVWHDTPERGPVSVWLLPAVLSGVSVPLRVEADRVVDQALDFLQQRDKGGRLLFVQLSDAGGPFDVDAEDLAAVTRTNRQVSMDRHDAALAKVDRELQRLIDALPKNALLFVMGDRGVRLDEPRGEGHLWGQNLHPELIHVPLIVAAPGAGRRNIDAPVSLVDVGPTVLHFAGVEGAGEVDGVLLGSVLGGEEAVRIVRAEATRYGPDARSARRGRYRLIRGEKERVFDVGLDPRENTPLGADPAAASERRALLAELPADTADTVAPGWTSELGRVFARLAR